MKLFNILFRKITFFRQQLTFGSMIEDLMSFVRFTKKVISINALNKDIFKQKNIRMVRINIMITIILKLKIV